MSEKDIYTKQSFINLIARTMRSMELKILVSGIIEPISMECFSKESPRLYKQDEHKDVRQYCCRLFKDNYAKASAVASILCDLSAGVEMFTYKLVGTYELISMAKYACLAVPCSMENTTCEALDYLKLEYRPLNVLDKFTLILIDKMRRWALFIFVLYTK